MPRRRRKSYHHGDLAAALRASARASIARDGVAKFSLRAVAKQAEVDPAAVYRHYADKQALLEAVAEDGFIELATHMQQAQSTRRTPETRMAAIGAAYVHFAIAEPELFRAMFGPQRIDVPTIAAAASGGRSPYQILLDALAELHEAGRSIHPPERASLPAWSAIHGLAYLAIDGRIDDVEASIRDVTRSILRSLEPR